MNPDNKQIPLRRALALVLALFLVLLTACGPSEAGSEPEPEPVSISQPEPEPEPEPIPVAVEGVVKEVSDGRLVLTLADGTGLVLDTAGLSGLDVQAGDTVKAQYTGDAGSAVAAMVEVTEKAVVTSESVTGVVTEVTDQMILLTLEDGTDAALKASIVQSVAVKVGDTLTIRYNLSGSGAMSVTSVAVAPAVQSAASSVSSSQAQAVSQAASGGGASSGGLASSGGSSSDGGSSSYDPDLDINRWLEDLLAGMDQYDDDDDYYYYYDDDDDYAASSSQADTRLDSEKPGFLEELDKNPFRHSPATDVNEPDYGDVYKAVELINKEREKVGLNTLEADPDLMEMARIRANEQPAEWGHTRPDNRGWSTIFDDYGSTLWPQGENADRTRSTATKAVNSWMHSQGHKDNILRVGPTKIGVGFCCDPNSEYTYYWIMITAKEPDW